MQWLNVGLDPNSQKPHIKSRKMGAGPVILALVLRRWVRKVKRQLTDN